MHAGVKASFIFWPRWLCSRIEDFEAEKGREMVQTHSTLMSFMMIMMQKFVTGTMTQFTAASLGIQIAVFLMCLYSIGNTSM